MGCEEIEKVSALAPKARTPAERDFPVVNVWGALDSLTRREATLHTHATNILVDTRYTIQDIA
jgi:hypothetical protein